MGAAGGRLRQDFLPVSVWYTGGRARATMVRPPDERSREEWRADLERIAACGFSAVRPWIDWASAEPAPGEFDLGALELTMGLAGELGLGVVLQIYLDSAPDWLVRLYPDCRYVSAGGVPIDSQAAPGWCYDHPGVRRAAEGFMEQVARRVADHPAMLAWDLWSEPHIVQWGYFDFLPQPAAFCYCHHTQERFRAWLRRRYRGDLEALNRAWYRTFSSWDVIPAPKFISLMTYTEYVDWLQFLLDKLAEDLRWRHETVRRFDGHLTSSHSAVPSLLTLPTDSQGSPDDWRMARVVDVWGTSLYPKHLGAAETQDPAVRGAMLDAARSSCDAAGIPYWLGELQAGHGYVGMFAAPMSPQDARAYGWQAMAHGCKGIHWYAWHPMSTGYESAGFGMANLDGTPSPRAEEAGKVARLVAGHAQLFLPAQPPKAQAAICWNVLANIMWVVMRERQHYVPSRAYLGAYRALWEERLPVDFLHVDQLASGELASYRLLYLPFALMLSRPAAEGIDRFVRDGGVVLAEARTAWNDEMGRCGQAVPGLGLEHVFGCREIGALGAAEEAPPRLRIVRAHPALPQLEEGEVILGSRFQQEFELLDEEAEVLGVFENGHPGLVARRHGRGWAILVGTLLSYGYHRHRDPGAGKLLKGLTRLAGLQPPVQLEGPAEVEARLLRGGQHQGRTASVLFLFNHGDRKVSVRLRLAELASAGAPGGGSDGGFQVRELESGKPVAISDGWLERALQAQEVWLGILEG